MSKRGIQAVLGHNFGYLQKGSTRLDLTCRGDLYFLRAKMVNDHVHDCAPVMRDDEDVPMRQDGDEDGDVQEPPEDAGVDDDGGEDAVGKHHQLTHIPFQARCEQCVRGRAPDPPHRRLGKQTNCLMKTSPLHDLITTPVGVDDRFGRCVAIMRRTQGCERCVGRGSTRSDGEHV